MLARSFPILLAFAAATVLPTVGRAATIAPPMLDITHQCNAVARRNATAMSECVVAESEARADLLSHWDKLSDAAVERCIKLGRKARRQPYVAMEKCLSPDLASPAPTPVKSAKP